LASSRCYIFLGRQRLLYFIWQALVGFLYSMFGSSCSIFFGKH
jgi:hypothetical protein